MITLLYSVYDAKASTYSPLFHAENHSVALRTFEQTIRSGESLLSKYPGDFHLMAVGSFDSKTGIVANDGTPVDLGSGDSFVQKLEVK